jgi:hypothetical protein
MRRGVRLSKQSGDTTKVADLIAVLPGPRADVGEVRGLAPVRHSGRQVLPKAHDAYRDQGHRQ